MTGDQILDIAKEAIFTLLWVAGPIMGIALAVGLLVSLFQALTSIQEMTLTFVPKILVVFIALIAFLPLMADHLNVMAKNMFTYISASGDGMDKLAE